MMSSSLSHDDIMVVGGHHHHHNHNHHHDNNDGVYIDVIGVGVPAAVSNLSENNSNNNNNNNNNINDDPNSSSSLGVLYHHHPHPYPHHQQYHQQHPHPQTQTHPHQQQTLPQQRNVVVPQQQQPQQQQPQQQPQPQPTSQPVTLRRACLCGRTKECYDVVRYWSQIGDVRGGYWKVPHHTDKLTTVGINKRHYRSRLYKHIVLASRDPFLPSIDECGGSGNEHEYIAKHHFPFEFMDSKNGLPLKGGIDKVDIPPGLLIKLSDEDDVIERGPNMGKYLALPVQSFEESLAEMHMASSSSSSTSTLSSPSASSSSSSLDRQRREQRGGVAEGEKAQHLLLLPHHHDVVVDAGGTNDDDHHSASAGAKTGAAVAPFSPMTKRFCRRRSGGSTSSSLQQQQQQQQPQQQQHNHHREQQQQKQQIRRIGGTGGGGASNHHPNPNHHRHRRATELLANADWNAEKVVTELLLRNDTNIARCQCLERELRDLRYQHSNELSETQRLVMTNKRKLEGRESEILNLVKTLREGLSRTNLLSGQWHDKNPTASRHLFGDVIGHTYDNVKLYVTTVAFPGMKVEGGDGMITPYEQALMCIMKLIRGYDMETLGYIYGRSTIMIGKYIDRWMPRIAILDPFSSSAGGGRGGGGGGASGATASAVAVQRQQRRRRLDVVHNIDIAPTMMEPGGGDGGGGVEEEGF